MNSVNALRLIAAAAFAPRPIYYGDDLWYSEANKTCRTEAKLTGPFWLHRWIGTYYNGTIEVTVDIENDDDCGRSRTVFNETYTGVLSLLDPKYAGPASRVESPDAFSNPFIFLLDGWAPDTTQASLFADRLESSYLPPAVKLEMESVNSFRSENLAVPPGHVPQEHLSPACKVSNATISADSDYNFNCHYFTGGVKDYSQFSLPISACNNPNTAPFLATNTFNSDDNGNSTVRGTFNEKSADLEWNSAFYGWFSTSSIKQNNITGGQEYANGIFTMKFKGNVDAENSHQMVLRPGSNITWVENVKKANATTFCAAALNVTQDEKDEKGLGISLHTNTWVAAVVITGWSLVWVDYL